jgi:hypothetical protein
MKGAANRFSDFLFTPAQHREMAQRRRRWHDACRYCEDLAVAHDQLAVMIEKRITAGKGRVIGGEPMPRAVYCPNNFAARSRRG